MTAQTAIPQYRLTAPFKPTGDQPQAIERLSRGIQAGEHRQVLLGVTGSGKTFTMANVIAEVEKPALVIAPNKTLAAQLYNEFKALFPHNAVEYFVSYYDYYQPEAYIPASDTYIQKDSSINEMIDKLRHSATRSVLSRSDVIVVASVSCIYGLGAPEEYLGMRINLETDGQLTREQLLRGLVDMQYERNDVDFHRGTFRVRGDRVEIFPSYEEDKALRIDFFGDQIDGLAEIDPLRGNVLSRMPQAVIFPASHYVTDKSTLRRAIETIKDELKQRVAFFRSQNKWIEAQRIEERTLFDLEMMLELGYCNGIENYSRHLTGRAPGEPPPTLLDYFPEDFVVFIDESHITVSQLRAMYRGDRSRKSTLVEYGFRLPSALDNRPLMFEEFQDRVARCVYVSATPGEFELGQSESAPVEQIVRPTGLLDPRIFIRKASHQVDDLYAEILDCTRKGWRVLVTTLTKRMAEDLTDYYSDLGVRVRYLHADIGTLERMEIIRDLRKGVFDVLVGINLLREGLDIPEVCLVAILDADKEGFLRSTRSLVQTFGRAARNAEGRVLLYADQTTAAMTQAISETDRRRKIQADFNRDHGITPATIAKPLDSAMDAFYGEARAKESKVSETLAGYRCSENIEADIEILENKMRAAAKDLDFEQAAALRDQINALKKQMVFDL